MTHTPGRPIYCPRPQLDGNCIVAQRTDDAKVIRLISPRRWIRGTAGYCDTSARPVAA